MDSSTYGEALQDHSAAPRLCPDVYNADNYTYCPWAKCVTGLDPNSERYVLIGVTCKRWGCPYCAVRKVRRLAWMSKNAAPNRLLTVTVSSYRYTHGKEAWDATSKAFPELIRYARSGEASLTKDARANKRAGLKYARTPIECEYLRVLELQDNGMPHFHVMLRSNFLLHKDMLDEWRRLIGTPTNWTEDTPKPKEWAGVNLKKIDDTFRTFHYLVKYLTKLHKIPWTDRHVSYSRGFFQPEDLEQVEYAKLDQVTKYDEHPWVWLRERLAWETVAVLGEGKWILDGPPPERHFQIDPKSLGLPGEPDPAPPPPLEQRLVPGLAADDLQDPDKGLRPDGKRRRTRRSPCKLPEKPAVPIGAASPTPIDDF